MTSLNAAARSWVLDLSAQPHRMRERWEADPSASVLVRLGHLVDAVEVAEGLGCDAVQALRRQGRRVGPVVWDRRAEVVLFLVPAGSHAPTVTALAAHGLGGGALPYRYLGAGCCRRLPGAAPTAETRLRWLEPPTGSPQVLTKGADLAAAFGELVAAADAIEASWYGNGPRAAAS